MNNIICNDCMGGMLYKNYIGSRYMNPFANTLIPFEHYLQICKSFNTLDMSDVRMVTKDAHQVPNFVGTKESQAAVINNSIYVWFPHSRKDTATTKDMWMTRYKRMKASSFDNNLFLLDQRGFHPMFTVEDHDIETFLKTPLNGKKMVVTGNPDFKSYEDRDTRVFVKNSSDINTNTELIWLNNKLFLYK